MHTPERLARSTASSSAGRALDAALEALIVTSFSRVGALVRARLDRWTPLDHYDLSGRTVLVTGATSGLGLHAAGRLAGLGARVIVNGRNPRKLDECVTALAARYGTGRVAGVLADIAEPADVRRLADEVGALTPKIDTLIHNAGALSRARATNSAGVESTVATHVLGPFLLTALLLPALSVASPGRVITVASGGMYTAPLSAGELQMALRGYRGSVQYARAKRAQVTLNEMWAQRVPAGDVVFHAMHPGWADTPGVQTALPRFRAFTRPLLRDTEQGADTMVWLAADPSAALTSGGFWLDRRRRPLHRRASTRCSDTARARDELWSWCVAATGATVR